MITISPAQIVVEGTRGSVQKRTLVLRAGDPVTHLRFVSLDLESSDRSFVLPGGDIRVASSRGEIAAGGFLPVSVDLDLTHVHAGEFHGELLLLCDSGNQGIPLAVKVKDGWPVPFLVLLSGVAIGLMASAYRRRGKQRDEIIVASSHLRARLRGAPDAAAPFLDRIRSVLLEMDASLDSENWKDARQAIQLAEAVWLRWLKGREYWSQQLRYQAELLGRLQALPSQSVYVQKVKRAVEEAAQSAPELAGPYELRDLLDKLKEQLNTYLELQAQLEEVDRLRRLLPSGEVLTWEQRLRDLEERLASLAPGDPGASQALLHDVKTALSEIRLRTAPKAHPEGAKGALERTLPDVGFFSAAPSAPGLADTAEAVGAPWRLKIFTWGSYAVAVALLAGAGFSELYVSRPTYGAIRWSDYFTLFAWGFGAEATRAGVAELLQGWGLVGNPK